MKNKEIEKRAKPGRPPVDPESKRKSRTIVVSDDAWETLQGLAEADSCTVGRVVEGFLSKKRKK